MNHAALLALVVMACGGVRNEQPPFEPVGDVKQLMTAILEPAAEVYWDAVGTIVDAKGTQEIRPASEEEWAAVGRAALLIAESGNLLMVEGRRPAADRDRWMTLSRALVAVGKQAIAAAFRAIPCSRLSM